MSAQRNSVFASMPWLDATGRFSLLKSAVLVAIFLPAVWMAMEFTSGNWYFPSPFVLLIYHSGLWTTYLLLFSLLVTPLRKLTGWGKLVQVRRMLGVACFFYCALHILAWCGLRYWNWSELVSEGLTRPTLWVATISFIALAALAATSFDRAIRAMGAEHWRRLHQCVYAAAFLAVLHFLMSPGSLQGLPFLMAGAYLWLMAWRLLDAKRLGTSPRALAVIGLGATLFIFFLQPLWLATYHADKDVQSPWDAMMDNFNRDIWQYLGVPPVFVMLAWTVTTLGMALYRQRQSSPHAISRSPKAT